MRSNEVKDLTQGNVFKLILGFSVPLLLGMLFQQFYSMVDTIIVGKYLGVSALAEVGSTGSINFMIIGFCMGVCNGFAIPVAQKFGANNYKKLRKYVFNSAVLAAIFSIVMTMIVCVLCRSILEWMNTPSDIIDGAYSYIFVIFLGIPATYLYNLSSGIIRSLGDSKTPLMFLIMSSIINIVLDLVFIIVFKMGVAGAGLQYSITAIGSVILQTAVNGLGSLVVAAVTASSKISMFLCCPFDALGSTMATYAGQNVGAKKLSRISEGIKKSLLIGSVYSIIALVVSIFFGETIALLFVNAGETELLLMVKQCLVTSAAFFIPLCIVNVVRFTIQGMGYSTFAIFAGICEMIARALCGFILVPMFGFTAVCFASPIAWIFADAFLLPGYKNVSNKLKKKIEISEIDYKNNKDEKIEESITLID